MLPATVSEAQIQAFKFYDRGSVHQAATITNQLYELVGRFDRDKRDRAYSVASGLSIQGQDVVVSVGDHYKLWLNLTSKASRCRRFYIPDALPDSQPAAVAHRCTACP
jgi:hypothetical protein